MKILSIETSCDDTGVTILEVHPARYGRGKPAGVGASFKILSDNLASQTKIHNEYGGVYPVLAKREHIKNLPILLEKALLRARLNLAQIDLICVTYGPGLPPSLWAGITFVQELAKKSGVPVQPVNHMEGHVLSIFGKNKGKFKIEKLAKPILALLVSGGHTQLVLSKKWMEYEIIGETLDDAVGEAFDKVARMMDLPYPGGPHISKLAEEARKNPPGVTFTLPRPMLKSKNLDFSFSGLKTAVLYLIRDLKKEHSNILQNDKMKAAIALEFENAAIECLTYKTEKAIEKYGAKTLIVAGGVAANKHLKNELKRIVGKKIKLLFPTRELARDNSVMIGIAGYLRYIKNKKKTPKPETIKATGRLRL